jgi:ABC-2 type transport system ATP-binding protein
MDSRETVIRLENVSKTFVVDGGGNTIREKIKGLFDGSGKQRIHALKDINLEIKKGEFFGIVGRNGSGKSTLLRIMAGSYPPDPGGKVLLKGRYMRLALGMGFDPELTAHENIFLNASILGLSMRQIRERHDEIVTMAELEDYVYTPVKFFSSGMQSRLKFAIAVQAEADVFLMDEFFGGVGDLKFKEVSEKIFDESIVKGRTIVHVSHSLSTIKERCDRVLLLHKGEPVMIGAPDEVLAKYQQVMGVKPRQKRKPKPQPKKA